MPKTKARKLSTTTAIGKLAVETSFAGQRVLNSATSEKGVVVGTSIETNALSVIWDSGAISLVTIPSDTVVAFNII